MYSTVRLVKIEIFHTSEIINVILYRCYFLRATMHTQIISAPPLSNSHFFEGSVCLQIRATKLSLALVAALATMSVSSVSVASSTADATGNINVIGGNQQTQTNDYKVDIKFDSASKPNKPTVGSVTFTGTNNINADKYALRIYADANNCGSKPFLGQYEAPELNVNFEKDSLTDISVNAQNGDTAILITGHNDQHATVSYRGDVNFNVKEGATLNVSNKNTGHGKPTSDAIEIRVEDDALSDSSLTMTESPEKANHINVNFQGSGNITTEGGAGFYLLQSGQGNINVSLSDQVHITTNGSDLNERPYHMANHGINAVVQESYYSKAPTGASTSNGININKGTININSAASIEVNGAYAAGVYAHNASGDVIIQTTNQLHATGEYARGIQVEASEGKTTITNDASITLNKLSDQQTQKSHAVGIEVTVKENNTIFRNDKNGIKTDEKFGKGNGIVNITNNGSIDAAGTQTIGIRVDRVAKEQATAKDVLDSANVIDIKNNEDMALKGEGSKGIEVKNSGIASENIHIANNGWLNLTGAKTFGIDVDNKFGDVTVESAGAITLTQSQTQTSKESTQSGLNKNPESVGIKATAQNGSVTIYANKSNKPKDYSLTIDGVSKAVGIEGEVYGGNGNLAILNTKNISISNGTENGGLLALRHQKEEGDKSVALGHGEVIIKNQKLVEVSGQHSYGMFAKNEKGHSAVFAEGSLTVSGDNSAGIISISKDGNSFISTGVSAGGAPEKPGPKLSNDTVGEIKIEGDHLVGLYAQASGFNPAKEGQTKPTGSSASIENHKNLTVIGSSNHAIVAESKEGYAFIENSGTINIQDTDNISNSKGLVAVSEKYDAWIVHEGDVTGDNLKYGILAQAKKQALILLEGNIDVKDTHPDNEINQSFAVKAAGQEQNVVLLKGNVTGPQALLVESGVNAKNDVSLMNGIVASVNGYAIVLDTKDPANDQSQNKKTGFTTINIESSSTLVGQISGKNVSSEVSGPYENKIATTINNNGNWVIGRMAHSTPYETTILGTSGKNAIVNRGTIAMSPDQREAVAWNQMGVKTFENFGSIDLSTNASSGDWFTITNSTDEGTNLKRADVAQNNSDYYKVTDRTHDAKFDGQYVSNGGKFDLDINLGNDKTGYADVLIVDNVSLGTAPTVLSFTNRRPNVPSEEVAMQKGIEVVHIRGNESAEGAFVLGTTLTMNGYQYILERDHDDQNWYIRNFQQDAGGSSAPLIDPNAGAYLASSWLNARVFNHSLLDRRDSTWNQDETVWARIEHNDGDGRFFKDSQRSNLWSNVVQVGREFYKKDDRVAGLFAAYGRTKADNISPATNTSSRVEGDGYQLGAYWTYLPTYGDGPYVDLWGYWAWFDNKLTGQAVNGHTVKFDSDGFALSAETGWSWQPEDSRFTIEPHVQVIYSYMKAEDANVEGTTYGSGNSKGFMTRVGARFFNDSITTAEGAKLTPMLELNWLYNGADDTVQAGSNKLESELGRHVGELKLGWQGSMHKSWQSWAHIGWQRGSDHFRNLELQLGVGIKF